MARFSADDHLTVELVCKWVQHIRFRDIVHTLLEIVALQYCFGIGSERGVGRRGVLARAHSVGFDKNRLHGIY